MTALIGNLYGKGQKGFLARLHGNVELATGLHSGLAAIRIDHELRVDEIPMRIHQPFDAIGIPAGFLVRGKCHYHVARGLKAFFLQAHETYGHGNVLTFHVDNAAPIKPTVFFRQTERIETPVFAFCFHDVQVADIKYRSSIAAAV